MKKMTVILFILMFVSGVARANQQTYSPVHLELFGTHQLKDVCCSNRNGVGVDMTIDFTPNVGLIVLATNSESSSNGIGLHYSHNNFDLALLTVSDCAKRTLYIKDTPLDASTCADGLMFYTQYNIHRYFMRLGIINATYNFRASLKDGMKIEKVSESKGANSPFISVGMRF